MIMRFLFAVTALVALVVTAISGWFLVPYLRKLKIGQSINEIGPTWHGTKQGTPTMGGMMFVLGIIAAIASAYFAVEFGTDSMIIELSGKNIIDVTLSVAVAVAFGLIGFLDDYIKVVQKRNLGLLARFKILLQFAVTGLYLFGLYMNGSLSTALFLPFVGHFEMSYFFYIFAFLLIIGIVNAVNLTDGIDGLAGSVTVIVMLGYVAISIMVYQFATGVVASATAGALVGFLIWNFYPAKVFMGDTGSMFLGGMVATLAFCVGRPEILFLIGFLYMLEALSVILQVTWFKITKRIYGEGRRIFKMSPIHHHFEMKGMSEVKVVILFTSIAFIGVFAALMYIAVY